MSTGAHALTEADLTAVREVWDTMDAANAATDWDTYQQHLTQDIVALDPRHPFERFRSRSRCSGASILTSDKINFMVQIRRVTVDERRKKGP